MNEPEVTPDESVLEVDADELRKEAFTMALYVSVCVMAALSALAESTDRAHVGLLGLVWGTTVGLSLAHLFAFRLSARLVGSGTVDRRDVKISLAQLEGAVAVAALCTVPIVLLPAGVELDVVRFLLAGFISLVAYLTARSGGTLRHRALVYAAGVLVVAVSIAVTKNVLAGH